MIKLVEKLGSLSRQKQVFLPLLIAVVGLASYKTIDRNADWKNNATLFIHDVEVVPNSVLVNANVGKVYLDMADKEKDQSNKRIELLNKAEVHLRRALKFDPSYYGAYLNLGNIWYLRNNLEKTESNWKKAALEAWSTALMIDPTKASIRGGYRAITGKEWGE